MSDLISRQALKNTLTDWQMGYADKDKDVERFETLGSVIELVELLPTIEPKRGKWITSDLDSDFLTCSYCRENRIKMRRAYRRDYAEMFKFCHNCGARGHEGQGDQGR